MTCKAIDDSVQFIAHNHGHLQAYLMHCLSDLHTILQDPTDWSPNSAGLLSRVCSDEQQPDRHISGS